MRNFELFVPRSPWRYVNLSIILFSCFVLYLGNLFYPDMSTEATTKTVVRCTALSDADAEILQIKSLTIPVSSPNETTYKKQLIEPIKIPKFDEKDVSDEFFTQLVADYPTVSSNKAYRNIIMENSAEIKNIIPKDFKDEGKTGEKDRNAGGIVADDGIVENGIDEDIATENIMINDVTDNDIVIKNAITVSGITNYDTTDGVSVTEFGTTVTITTEATDDNNNEIIQPEIIKSSDKPSTKTVTTVNNDVKSEIEEAPIDKEKYSGGKFPYEDVYLLAQLIRGEAAYEGRHGMIAVAEVVLNRVNNERFPNTVSEVIHSPGQFANRSSIKYRKPTEEMVAAAYDVLNRNVRIFNKPDVLYFRNPRITSNIPPEKRVNWGDKPYYRCVGSHAFYLQKK